MTTNDQDRERAESIVGGLGHIGLAAQVAGLLSAVRSEATREALEAACRAVCESDPSGCSAWPIRALMAREPEPEWDGRCDGSPGKPGRRQFPRSCCDTNCIGVGDAHWGCSGCEACEPEPDHDDLCGEPVHGGPCKVPSPPAPPKCARCGETGGKFCGTFEGCDKPAPPVETAAEACASAIRALGEAK